MSIQFLLSPPADAPSRKPRARLWRRWWLRATKAQQRRRLEQVLTDPHMARDLGLPVVETKPARHDFW